MAVGAWATFDKFHEYMADGTIDMDAVAEFNIHLYNSSSNVVDTFSTATQIDNELASSNGYTLSGKSIASTLWSAGASSGETRFDSNVGVVWTASGGNLGNTAVIKFATIISRNSLANTAKDGTNKLVCFSQLSTAGFVVADGNTLTINPNATNGYLELNRV